MARPKTTKVAFLAATFGLLASAATGIAAPVDAAGSLTTTDKPAATHAPVTPQAAPAPAAPAAAAEPTADRLVQLRRVEAKRAKAEARRLKVRKIRARVVKVARKQVGDTYSAGGNGPNRFDCSGLTQFVFKVATGKSLPHQSRAQYSRVNRISKAKAQPGDLVFFFKGGAHHVGIYIGKGRMIDARGYGEGVRVSPISGSWWGRAYSGMGRILPAT